jgi:hypothetical protein
MEEETVEREAAQRAASPWNKLRRGMKKDRVISLLGEPRKKEKGVSSERWI